MLDTFLHSGRDTLLYAIPSLGLLVIAIFGLEETLVRPKNAPQREPKLSRVDRHGEPVLTDPDGRRVGRRR